MGKSVVRLGFKEDVLEFISHKFKEGDKVMLAIPRDRENYEFDGSEGEIIFIVPKENEIIATKEDKIAVQTPKGVVACNLDELELID